MNLLMLGGRVFLGRHIVLQALDRGFDITLFNRGRTNPDLFPELEHIQGDRGGDLRPLAGRQWDAVIDTSGYLPQHVRASAQTLAGSVGQYVFISTISVYAEPSKSGMDESALRFETLEEEGLAAVTRDNYGPLKVACENAVLSHFEGDHLIVRPGLIVGPYDPTDRFTYWPRRLSRPGQALAPGPPERTVQFIDVRDLAGWLLDLVQRGESGTFNATGPVEPITMKSFLERTRQAVDGEAELVWVPQEFLLGAGVNPFSEIPLWLPEEQNGLLQVDISRALESGLELRPVEDTAQDTLAWDDKREPILQRSAGLDPARELALLEAFQAQEGNG